MENDGTSPFPSFLLISLLFHFLAVAIVCSVTSLSFFTAWKFVLSFYTILFSLSLFYAYLHIFSNCHLEKIASSASSCKTCFTFFSVEKCSTLLIYRTKSIGIACLSDCSAFFETSQRKVVEWKICCFLNDLIINITSSSSSSCTHLARVSMNKQKRNGKLRCIIFFVGLIPLIISFLLLCVLFTFSL